MRRRRLCVRLSLVTSALLSLMLTTAAPAYAHGIGGRADLPVPLSYFIIGASAAVIVSFVALSALWVEPRLQDEPIGRPIRAPWLRAVTRIAQGLGLFGIALVVIDGLTAGNVTTRHISPVIVWVVFWLVFPYLVSVVGNLWLWMSPWRSIGRWINAGVAERTDLGNRLGLWPATTAFLVFAWLELISPNSSDPGTLATAALVYTIYLTVVTRVVGVETGLTAADAFENYYSVISAISPIDLGRTRPAVGTATTVQAATISWRGWLRGLTVLPNRRGMTWFIIALIGTVTFDGMSGAEWWRDVFGDVAQEQWFGTIAMIAVVAIIGGGYYLASAIAAFLAKGSAMSTREIAASFIHTLLPIALAYAFAHYFTLVLFEGQQLIHAASDPFGLGWNLFGTVDWRIVFFLSPTAIWWVQLVTIVLGHVAATALAHDRALHLFGDEVAIRTQYAMLGLMVALTSLGLFILAG
jgi:hypothetical protein